MDGDKLTEVLNIEISQRVITSVEEAVDWVKGTFLFQRMMSHPLCYGFRGNGNNEEALHNFIYDTCTGVVDKLCKINAIAIKDEGTFHPLPASHIMSRNFIDFKSMSSIVKLPHDSGKLFLLACTPLLLHFHHHLSYFRISFLLVIHALS